MLKSKKKNQNNNNNNNNYVMDLFQLIKEPPTALYHTMAANQHLSRNSYRWTISSFDFFVSWMKITCTSFEFNEIGRRQPSLTNSLLISFLLQLKINLIGSKEYTRWNKIMEQYTIFTIFWIIWCVIFFLLYFTIFLLYLKL
jgi:hypothetical protein